MVVGDGVFFYSDPGKLSGRAAVFWVMGRADPCILFNKTLLYTYGR